MILAVCLCPSHTHTHAHLPLDVISLLHHIEPNPSWRHLLLGITNTSAKRSVRTPQTDTHDIHTNRKTSTHTHTLSPTHTLETSSCHHRPQNKPQD